MSAQFDRQLILWGSEGQLAFERASIWLFGSDCLACEIAKGLLLTNLSQLTLIDSACISVQDLESCFLFDFDSQLEGRDRVSEVAVRLRQFSSGCRIQHYDKVPTELVERPSLIILANQWERPRDLPADILTIEAFAWGFRALIRTGPVGFPIWVSSIGNNVAEAANYEFWRNCQFPAFGVLCKEQCAERGEEAPVVFRAFALATSGVECNVGKDLEVGKLARKISSFKSLVPQNVAHALANAQRAPSGEVKMLEALNCFVQKHSRIPAIPSLIPDLEMETEDYLKIVHCFQSQFQKDLQEFPVEGAESWLKKCPFIHLLQVEEQGSPTGDQLFQATIKFYNLYRKLPGVVEELRETDEMHLAALVSGEKTGISEWIACGNVQMPCTCTVTGGIVCEQAIKLTSHAFVPNLQHLLVVDLQEGISVA